MSRETGRAAQHQFRFRGAIHAASFFVQNLQDKRIGRSFHREIFPKTGVPSKGRFQGPRSTPNAGFVINMERRRIGLHDLPRLIQRQKWLFAAHMILFSPLSAASGQYGFTIHGKAARCQGEICENDGFTFAKMSKRGYADRHTLIFAGLTPSQIKKRIQRQTAFRLQQSA